MQQGGRAEEKEEKFALKDIKIVQNTEDYPLRRGAGCGNIARQKGTLLSFVENKGRGGPENMNWEET
jgi:hypothetical protein